MSDKSKSTSPSVERIVCKVCGKTLTRDQSIKAVIGHRCDSLLAAGFDAVKLAAHYAQVTGAIPEGYVKLSDLDKKVKREKGHVPGLTISKMVKAIGRDRALESALHPIARPVYDVRRHRWVNGWLMTKAGLVAIATGDFSKAPKA